MPESGFDKDYNSSHLIISEQEFRDEVMKELSFTDIFTVSELNAFPPAKSLKSLAGRYLIKKCLFDMLEIAPDFKNIELLNNEFGKPEFKFSKEFEQKLLQHKVGSVSCSMSHSRNHITGMVALGINK